MNKAMEELIKIANMGEPLWVRSVEAGREVLNYDEYVNEFAFENSSSGRPKISIEASRDWGCFCGSTTACPKFSRCGKAHIL